MHAGKAGRFPFSLAVSPLPSVRCKACSAWIGWARPAKLPVARYECQETDIRACDTCHFFVASENLSSFFWPSTRVLSGALSALAVTLPHALGLGLIAFAALSHDASASALALWSAAIPGALMTLFLRGKGVVYAPSTAVALLFGGMLSMVVQAGEPYGVSAPQALAITGVFVALGFGLQWLLGWAGLAGLSRFLPFSVTRGFSAGIGLSLILSQVHPLMAASSLKGQAGALWHLGIALSVAVLSVLLQRLWPRFPALLTALVLVSVPVLLWVPLDWLVLAAKPQELLLPPLPDWWGAPWWEVLKQVGLALASLSLLIGVVNGLEVLVFHQQLEAEHGVLSTPDEILQREGLWGAFCALLGLIPASTSTSRSRTALALTGVPTIEVGQWHAWVLLLVASTGHTWLHWVPMAGLSGALLVAGSRMLPVDMIRPADSKMKRDSQWQSWLVALVFAASGGAMALVAGMTISTLVLLRTSAEHAIRRMHLHGGMRSRHVRPAVLDAWLNHPMSQVAVFELQGIFSFSVAALVVDRVHKHLQGHVFVILDVSRVSSWDETGLARLKIMARELSAQGIGVAISGFRAAPLHTLEPLRSFDDLDRALEWIEDQFLNASPVDLQASMTAPSVLGDLETRLSDDGRRALLAYLESHQYEANAMIIQAGSQDRALLLVQQGTVVISTQAYPEMGLRLMVSGAGTAFGEMAFLKGGPRSAFAHAGPQGARVMALEWDRFQEWTDRYPADALQFMRELARFAMRRLSATSQELRAAME